ncbi:MAG: VIT family protein [Bacteroidales bacterium]
MSEQHFNDRIGWLRASVLGANDGIVSVASLITGVAASGAGKPAIMVAAVAGLVAGAMSMAAGEYVSVSSQSDTENADIEREKRELEEDYEGEVEELTGIYERRGLDSKLAREVAVALMGHNALDAHVRDELGISEFTKARPIQAAVASAGSFISGAALPLVAAMVAPLSHLIESVSISTILFLALLGAVAARTGGSGILKGVARVTFWGVAAMVATALAGSLFGAVIN